MQYILEGKSIFWKMMFDVSCFYTKFYDVIGVLMKNQTESFFYGVGKVFPFFMCLVMLFFGSLLFAGDKDADGLIIELKEYTAVQGSLITVQDLASLEGNQELLNRVAGIIVGRTPKHARPKEVLADEISSHLMRSGISQEDIFLTGASQIFVYNAAFVVLTNQEESQESEEVSNEEETNSTTSFEQNTNDGPVTSFSKPAEQEAPEQPSHQEEDLIGVAIAAIQEQMADNLGLQPDEIFVKEQSRNNALRQLSSQGLALFIDAFPKDNGPFGDRSYELLVKVDGEEVDDLILKVEVGRYAEVVVAHKTLEQDQAFRHEDLRIERRIFKTRSEDYFTEIEDVVGLAPKRELSADTLILPENVAPAILVERSEIVTAEAGLAHCQVKALEDGAKGDLIKVSRVAKVGSNQKKRNGGFRSHILLGRVIGQGKVRIESSR